MQSRTEMRKRNNRNNLYLIIIGIIVVIAIICGFIIHNQRVAAERSQREYASTHFNPNVTIYGVQVGKLTVNKATAKINKQADNVVFLRNKKIIMFKLSVKLKLKIFLLNNILICQVSKNTSSNPPKWMKPKRICKRFKRLS